MPLGNLDSIAQLIFKKTLFSKLFSVLFLFRAVISPQTENIRLTYAWLTGAATDLDNLKWPWNGVIALILRFFQRIRQLYWPITSQSWLKTDV